jgi:hypothetical protein
VKAESTFPKEGGEAGSEQDGLKGIPVAQEPRKVRFRVSKCVEWRTDGVKMAVANCKPRKVPKDGSAALMTSPGFLENCL